VYGIYKRRDIALAAAIGVLSHVERPVWGFGIPYLLPSFILFQILITWWFVWKYARQARQAPDARDRPLRPRRLRSRIS